MESEDPIVADLALPNSAKPWMKYAGMVKSGDPMASQTIDELLYDPDEYV